MGQDRLRPAKPGTRMAWLNLNLTTSRTPDRYVTVRA